MLIIVRNLYLYIGIAVFAIFKFKVKLRAIKLLLSCNRVEYILILLISLDKCKSYLLE